MDPKEEMRKKTEEIEAVYKSALGKLNELKEEQSKIINKFIKDLEDKRMADLKKIIAEEAIPN